MKNLTAIQIEELTLMYSASKAELLKGVEGVFKVAKAIQLYLSCTIEEAIQTLGNLVNSEKEVTDFLLKN